MSQFPKPKYVSISTDLYEHYIDVYSDLCYDKIMENIELNFYGNETNETKEQWLETTFNDLDWVHFSSDNVVAIKDSDKQSIIQLTKAFSIYLDFAGSTTNLNDLPWLCCQVFLTECYIKAIRRWTWDFSQHFFDNKLFNETFDILNDYDRTCETFFDGF